MDTMLQNNDYRIEEQATPLQLEYRFVVRDRNTGATLLNAEELQLGRWVRLCRCAKLLRRATPFDIQIRTIDGQPVVRLTRGILIAISRVRVFGSDGALIGFLRQRPFSVGGAFDVLDATNSPVCRLQGRATGTEFNLLAPDGVRLARITKQWAGLGKELFTSADHYRMQVDEVVPPDPTLRQLILAAGIGIGLIMKIEIP